MIDLYTIGFTRKSAEQFFSMLENAGVKRVVDVRLNNRSQLAGFTKQPDFPFFLDRVAGIEYSHLSEFAPTKVILDNYKKKTLSWEEYETGFRKRLDVRFRNRIIDSSLFEHACLLCSEPTPGHCHRRLVAEFIASRVDDVVIRHLV